jgi:predicted nucleic-acid-binding protein
MLAVDTNILVRALIRDDPGQTARAQSILEAEEVWIAKTVLLETNWVLGKIYRTTAEQIRNGLTGLIGLPNVQIEDEAAVRLALRLFEGGLDFADALHLASRPLGAMFLSFDEALVRRAERAGAPGVKLAGKKIIN